MKRNRPDDITYAVQTFHIGPDQFLTDRGNAGFRRYEAALERFASVRFRSNEPVRLVRCVNGIPRETVLQ